MNAIILTIAVVSAYVLSPLLMQAGIPQPWAFLILLGTGLVTWIRDETIRMSRR